MTCPFMELSLVNVVNVDEHNMEASAISKTILNRFILNIKHLSCIHVFVNFDELVVVLLLVVFVDINGDIHDAKSG